MNLESKWVTAIPRSRELLCSESLIGADEACRHIGVSRERLYRLVDEGVVPAYMIGSDLRFRLPELPSLS